MKSFFDFLKALIKVQQWWKLLIICFMFCFALGCLVYVIKFDGINVVREFISPTEKIIEQPATEINSDLPVESKE